MDAILKVENSKTADSHWLFFNLSERKKLKRGDKYVALTRLRGKKNSNCLMDQILYQIFKIISSISLKSNNW